MLQLLAGLFGGSVVALILASLILAVLWPLAAIWGVNVLFGLAIPYSIKTYFASLVVCGVFKSSSSSSNSKK